MTSSIARMLNLSRKDLLQAVGLIAVAVSTSLLPICLPAAQAQTTDPAVASTTHPRGDISGNWQGTLDAGKSLRLVMVVAKTDKGWSGKFYSIDQGGQAINASGIVLDGAAFKLSVDAVGGSYEGRVSADGNAIVGSWTQGGKTFPLTLVRASKDTAWEIPEPPVPPKKMAADADPSFEVATIKPNNPDQPGDYISVNGRNFTTHNISLAGLIKFAYGVHAKQIVNGPEWMDKETYDITAVPDAEGQPNNEQWKTMLQKLLADRFKLAFHHDKRELSIYALSIVKGGSKNMTENTSGRPLPGMFFGGTPGGIMLPARNATMADFAGLLQSVVLDRPVVDQTGLTGRFDFTLKWAPDESQFGGHVPPPSETPNAPPGLFTALQEQVGLKLDAVKTAADVMAIDHVEKPSAN